MTDTVQDLAHSRVRGFGLERVMVYALLFVSGFAALSYEASWSRLVDLVLGHTTEAAAIVLAAFFAGMALGQALQAILGMRRPLLAFGFAELCTAVWAFAVPGLLDGVGDCNGISRPFACFLILLPATTAMGATLPLMVDFLIAKKIDKSHISGIYAVNTLGGLVAIVAVTAVLLILVGIRTSGFVAASLSAICGTIAIFREFHSPTLMAAESGGKKNNASGAWGWAALAALSGFATMGLEVLYTRMFELVFHNSTYTFAAILAAFLLALSLGAVVSALVGRWVRNERSIAMGACLACAVTLAISLHLFRQVTALDYFSAGQSFGGYLAAAAKLLAIVVIPPVTCLGMLFPIGLRAVAGSFRVGWLSAANSLAGAAGALLAGFTLPSLLGLWPSFGIFVGLMGLTGAVLLLCARARFFAAVAALGTTLLVALSGYAPNYVSPGTKLIQRWESSYGWIDVVQSKSTDAIQLRQNLHYQHGSTSTAIREYRQGRLPLALHPRPRDVAFLGLGTGHTAAPAIVDPAVKSAVIVELIPEVVKASRLFSSTNLGVVDHSKVEIQISDARTFLRRTRRRFDVIVSDLYVPWESHAGYLYSVDFYRLARQRLKPRGLFCQWIALYQVGESDFQMIADSFASIFPETTIWWGQFDSRFPIIALIGSEKPRMVYQELLERRLESQEVLPGAQDPDLYLPQDVPDLFLGSWNYSPQRRVNSDEHPWLEFTAPISHRDGRTLHGQTLRAFFDNSLSKLPNSGVDFVGHFRERLLDVDRRRARQRLSLFGDEAADRRTEEGKASAHAHPGKTP